MRVKRPLFGLLIPVVLGTWMGLWTSMPFIWFVWLSVIVLSFICVFMHSPRIHVLLYLQLLILCWFNSSVSYSGAHVNQLRNRMKRSQEYLELMGVVKEDPVIEQRRNNTRSFLFMMQLEAFNRNGEWVSTKEKIRCRIIGEAHEEKITYGERWLFKGSLRQQSVTRFGIPLQQYYLDAKMGQSKRQSAYAGSSWVKYSLWGRAFCKRLLSKGIIDFHQELGVLHALLLGYRNDLPREWLDKFSITGTMHIFAISGLHVGVMALIIIQFLRMFGVSKFYWILFLAPLLIVYILGTGMKASALRACTMALIYWGAPLLSRKPDAPNALAFAAIVILISAPTQLIDLGFNFSFVVVSGLLLFCPVFIRYLPMSALKSKKIPSYPLCYRITRSALSLIVVSVAAWLSAMPMTAQFFNLITPVGVMANLFVVPMTFLIVFTGCCSLLFGVLFESLSEVFNHANSLFISMLLRWIRLCAELPWSHFYVRAPGLLQMWLWYALMLVSIRGRKRYRLILLPILVFTVFYMSMMRSERHILRCTALAAGYGSANYLTLPGYGALLLDPGPRTKSKHVLRYLRKQGVNRIKVMVLSHADAQHVGGALWILNGIKVDEVWCSSHRGRSSVYNTVINTCKSKGISIRYLQGGASGAFGKWASWEVLHPPGGWSSTKADDAAIAMKFSYRDMDLMWISQLTEMVLEAMHKQPAELSAELLLMGQSLPREVDYTDLIEVVDPQWILFRSGSKGWGVPFSDELMNTLLAKKITYFDTLDYGSIELSYFMPKQHSKEIQAVWLERVKTSF